jgi:hypothetical protein
MQEQKAARVARVSKADAISVAGGLYQPLRRRLGIRAFGINAYFASSAGDQLIEPTTRRARAPEVMPSCTWFLRVARASWWAAPRSMPRRERSSSFRPRRRDERLARSQTTPRRS